MSIGKKQTKLLNVVIISLFLFTLIGQFAESYTNVELNTTLQKQIDENTGKNDLSTEKNYPPKQENTGTYISFGENVNNSTVKQHIDANTMLLNLTIEIKDENYLKNVSIFYNNNPFVIIGEGLISIDNEEMFRNTTFFRYNASFNLLYEELESEGFYNITAQMFNGEDKVITKKLLFTLLLPSISIVEPSDFSQVEKSFNLEWSVTHTEIINHFSIFIDNEYYKNVTETNTVLTLPVNEEEVHLDEKYYYFTLLVKAFTIDDFFNYTTIVVVYISPASESTNNPIEISPWFYVAVTFIGIGIIGSLGYLTFKWIKKRPPSDKTREKVKHLSSSQNKKKEKNENMKKEAKKIVADLRKKDR